MNIDIAKSLQLRLVVQLLPTLWGGLHQPKDRREEDKAKKEDGPYDRLEHEESFP